MASSFLHKGEGRIIFLRMKLFLGNRSSLKAIGERVHPCTSSRNLERFAHLICVCDERAGKRYWDIHQSWP